jgi:hypothetical protein
MTNYQNDIMEILQGETPRQKYEFLQELLKMFKENNSGVEVELLNVCHELDKKGEKMYATMGNESYVERCHNHDAKMLIYGLTNKSKIEKMTYIKWCEEVQSKR